MNLAEEEKWIHEVKSNPEAFSILFEEYYSQLLNFAVRRTGNIEIARDVVSETFYKAFKNIPFFIWNNISFSSWLYRICNNEINQYYRKSDNKRKIAADNNQLLASIVDDFNLEEEMLKTQEEFDKHERFLAVQQKILALPLKYQEVLVLRYFEDKSIKEIAEILRKSEGTVKSLIHRGIKKVKNEFDESATFFVKEHYN